MEIAALGYRETALVGDAYVDISDVIKKRTAVRADTIKEAENQVTKILLSGSDASLFTYDARGNLFRLTVDGELSGYDPEKETLQSACRSAASEKIGKAFSDANMKYAAETFGIAIVPSQKIISPNIRNTAIKRRQMYQDVMVSENHQGELEVKRELTDVSLVPRISNLPKPPTLEAKTGTISMRKGIPVLTMESGEEEVLWCVDTSSKEILRAAAEDQIPVEIKTIEGKYGPNVAYVGMKSPKKYLVRDVHDESGSLILENPKTGGMIWIASDFETRQAMKDLPERTEISICLENDGHGTRNVAGPKPEVVWRESRIPEVRRAGHVENDGPQDPFERHALLDTPEDPFDNPALMDTPEDPFDNPALMDTPEDPFDSPVAPEISPDKDIHDGPSPF
jgi:hypothetical protein